MNKQFEFNEEDFRDPKKFMRKVRAMLRNMREGLDEEKRKDLDDLTNNHKNNIFEVRSWGSIKSLNSLEEAMNISEFMIKNGIESFFSITRKRGGDYNKNIDDVYEHYVNVDPLEFDEVFINNVNYLLEYYVEDEQYEKCVYLQWLQEQYAEYISK